MSVPTSKQHGPMTDERRQALLAAAARHARRFDDARRGRGHRTLPRVVALRPRPDVQPAEDVQAPSTVSPRQLEVLRLIADGHRNLAIARMLWISPRTR